MAHLPNTSASASTSTAPSPKTNYNPHYDVIINHSGSDVKNNFGSHLYHRLLDRGFKTLFERREMQQVDRLDSRTGAAIATASIHIPIFSPRYAESTCSLDELRLILKSKAAIIPVFYNVKPSDLRIRMGEGQEQVPGQISAPLGDPVGNNGVYDEALRGHEKEGRCGQQTIADWKKALFDVSHFSGLELEACESDEGELVDRVVQRAEEEVAKPQFQVGKYVIGLDKKLEDLEKAVLLQRQQHKGKAKFVGIVGVGGVGKTTLVTEFFKRKRSAYHRSCFLSDVREAAGRSSLHSLQNKLIMDFTSRNGEIVSVDDGEDKLISTLSNFQGLVILDDVDDVQQMYALYSPLKDVLHSSSLILVTSRDKNVLERSGIRESNIYNLTGLDKEGSQELFCLHAFHKRLPVFRFKEVVPKFLDVCGGLPLCLKVLGALVYQKDLKYWKTSLRKIPQGSSTDIQGMLKIGYDSLDDQEKEIFLDIACFLTKEDRDTVINIWEASGWVGRLNLQNLLNKCFVEIDSKGRIKMPHHLIEELGRELAEKEPPSFCRRLWRPTQNHFDNAWLNSIVRGFNMVEVRSGSSVNNPVELNNSFADMSRLQLLKAEGDCLESISTLLPHSDLLWLCWNRCPYTSLPSWIPTRNLRVLRVAGITLETLWHHENEAPLNLRELIIDAANFRLPEAIRLLKYLEKIEVRSTMQTLPEVLFQLTSLVHLRMYTSGRSLTLPESLGNLTNLRDLDLSGCSTLKRLPESFGNLMNLRDLHLSGCSQLQLLPDSLGNLTGLQQLHLSNCSQLQALPDSLGNLTGLQQLHLSNCSQLQALPDSLGNLTGLGQHLDLSSCFLLRALPDSFGNLTGLQHLDLSSCFRLQALPDSLGNLTGLQHLRLDSSQLQALPDSLGNLTGLQHLRLSKCSQLQALPDSLGNLTGLQQLDLFDCHKLQALPDSLGNLTGLQYLFLSCSQFQALPDSLGNLTCLQELGLYKCSQLQALPDWLGNLTGLQYLQLSWCSQLQALRLGNLTGLQTLNLFECSKLQALPDSLGNLTGLQKLHLINCSQLQALPDSLGNLTGLRNLDLARCSQLQALPDSLGNLTGLHNLDLSRCSQLQALPDSLGNLTGLQKFTLSSCFRLQALPDSLGNLIGLQHLDLSRCSQLPALPDSLGNLTGLQQLHLSSCSQLRALPDSLGNLSGLQQLHLSSCSQLQALPDSLGDLTGLQQLSLSNCSRLQALPDSLGNLTGLQHLDLSNCSQLQALPDSLGNLTGLQQLDLSRCSQLQALSESLGNLTGLQQLHLSSCSQLQALPDSLGNLTGLQHLHLSACSQLQALPDSLGNLTGLQQLDLCDCYKLQALPYSLGNLTGLQHLDLSYCSQFQALPDWLGNLTGLQHLDLSGCSQLQALPDSLGNLTGLQHLDLSYCSQLQALPDSVWKLTRLQRLEVYGYSQSRGLQDSDLSDLEKSASLSAELDKGHSKVP